MVTAMQKMAVERARSGEIGIRPSERRRQVEEAQMAAGGGAYGAPRPDAYGAHPLPHGLPPSASTPSSPFFCKAMSCTVWRRQPVDWVTTGKLRGRRERCVPRLVRLCLSQVVRRAAGAALVEEAAASRAARAMTTVMAVGAAAAEGAALALALATSPPATTRAVEEASRRGKQGQAVHSMYLGQ